MISDYLADKMVELKVIAEDDRPLYLYGLHVAEAVLLNIVITAMLGVLFHNLLQTATFLAAYIPLRSYAGGYHASSAKRCFVYSVVLIIILEFYFSYGYLIEKGYLLAASILAVCLIYKYAPQQSINKPLSVEERRRYAKTTKKILLLEVGLAVAFLLAGLAEAADGVQVAVVVEGVLLAVGKSLVDCK